VVPHPCPAPHRRPPLLRSPPHHAPPPTPPCPPPLCPSSHLVSLRLSDGRTIAPMAGFLPHCVPRTWTLLLAGPPCWSSSHLLSPSLRHWPRSLAAAPSCSPCLLVGGRGSRACVCVVDVSINLTLLIGVFLRIFTVSVSIVYPSATTPPCAITPHATSAALSLGIAPMIACVGSQTGLSSDPRSEEALCHPPRGHRPATPPS
jgi:hypothetical protein